MARVSEYRTMLEGLQSTARQIVLDEIEEEVDRLREFISTIDMDDPEAIVTGIDTIKLGLKELAEKLY